MRQTGRDRGGLAGHSCPRRNERNELCPVAADGGRRDFYVGPGGFPERAISGANSGESPAIAGILTGRSSTSAGTVAASKTRFQVATYLRHRNCARSRRSPATSPTQYLSPEYCFPCEADSRFSSKAATPTARPLEGLGLWLRRPGKDATAARHERSKDELQSISTGTRLRLPRPYETGPSRSTWSPASIHSSISTSHLPENWRASPRKNSWTPSSPIIDAYVNNLSSPCQVNLDLPGHRARGAASVYRGADTPPMPAALPRRSPPTSPTPSAQRPHGPRLRL